MWSCCKHSECDNLVKSLPLHLLLVPNLQISGWRGSSKDEHGSVYLQIKVQKIICTSLLGDLRLSRVKASTTCSSLHSLFILLWGQSSLRGESRSLVTHPLSNFPSHILPSSISLDFCNFFFCLPKAYME